eukprot:Pgem_evm1s12022
MSLVIVVMNPTTTLGKLINLIETSIVDNPDNEIYKSFDGYIQRKHAILRKQRSMCIVVVVVVNSIETLIVDNPNNAIYKSFDGYIQRKHSIL